MGAGHAVQKVGSNLDHRRLHIPAQAGVAGAGQGGAPDRPRHRRHYEQEAAEAAARRAARDRAGRSRDGGVDQARDAGQRPGPMPVVARRDHEARVAGAALAASEPQMRQRHVTAPGIDDRLQIGVRLMLAGSAEHQHADIAGGERGARRRQLVGHRAKRSAWRRETEDRGRGPPSPAGSGAGLCQAQHAPHGRRHYRALRRAAATRA